MAVTHAVIQQCTKAIRCELLHRSTDYQAVQTYWRAEGKSGKQFISARTPAQGSHLDLKKLPAEPAAFALDPRLL